MEDGVNKPTQAVAIQKFVSRALAFKRDWEDKYGLTISCEEVAELTYLELPERQRYLHYPDYKLIELIFVEHVRQRSSLAKAA